METDLLSLLAGSANSYWYAISFWQGFYLFIHWLFNLYTVKFTLFGVQIYEFGEMPHVAYQPPQSNQDIWKFHYPKILCASFVVNASPIPWQPVICFPSISVVFPFPRCHLIKRFWVWLLSLIKMHNQEKWKLMFTQTYVVEFL